MPMSNGVVIGYYRLSVEDDALKLESDSIVNQRLLIRKYIAEHKEFDGCELVEYCDDGYSGTNMDRPGMKKLLENVKNQEVSCIIVKDFSRFSRDYIELGSYMEQIFPFMGIRFISVTDHYDSDDYIGKTADIDVGFKNLLADFYCKDISEKVKSTLEVKRKQGKYCTGAVPIGYYKNPKDRNELLVIEEEAGIIKSLFELRFMGLNLTEICKILNDEGIMTPIELRNKRKALKRKEFEKKRLYWQANTVYSILTNEIYIGNMVYGKSDQAGVGSKKKILKPRSQWKIYENHHIPIVDRDMFDAVQESFFKRNNSKRRERDYALKGKVYCGGCGRLLRISILSQERKVYYCEFRGYATVSECYSGRIDNDLLEDIILAKIREALSDIRSVKEVMDQSKVKCKGLIHGYKKQLKGIKESVKAAKAGKAKYFEEYHEGRLIKDDFIRKRKDLDESLCGYMKQETELEENINRQTVYMKDESRDINHMLSYSEFDKLTREMVDSFLDRVYLYDDRRIEILWKFSKPELESKITQQLCNSSC